LKGHALKLNTHSAMPVVRYCG